VLVTLQDLRDYLGEKDSSHDTRLNTLGARASQVVANYCLQTTLEETTHTDEFYDGSGTDILLLNSSPVTAVASVLELGVALTVGRDPSAVPAPEILWYPDGRLVRPWSSFLAYPNYYKVTSTRGYAVADVPPTIAQAVLDLAAIMVKEKDRIGLQSKVTGSQTVQYMRKIPDEVREALGFYVRRRAA